MTASLNFKTFWWPNIAAPEDGRAPARLGISAPIAPSPVRPCSGETRAENSPVFQRRERWTQSPRPEGTVEARVGTVWKFSRPFGT